MAHDILHTYFGEITAKRNDEGALIVFGKATGPDLDLDHQICDPEWLAQAMPEWMKIGNIREQHQPIAAGIGLELSQDNQDWYLKAEVVDDNTARKVEKKVLKGFSIGIKNARVVSDVTAPNGRIVAGDIVEVSLVDRPANPTAMIEIAKSVNGVLSLNDIEKADVPQDITEVRSPSAKDSEDQYPSQLPCPACNGIGETVDTHEVCTVCNGTGFAPEDLHAEANEGSNPALLTDKDANDEKSVVADPEDEVAVDPLDEGDLPNNEEMLAVGESKALTIGDVKARLATAEDAKTWIAGINKMASHDPVTLKQVLDGIVALIKAELDEMLMGEENEICDVLDLVYSLNMFLCWWEGEADEHEAPAPFTMDEESEDNMAYVALGVEPDLIKRATVEEATPEDRIELRSEIVKALGLSEVIAGYETALTEQQEAIKSLEATVEQMKSLAVGGGPVLRQTSVQASKSADVDRLQAEASRLRDIAKSIENGDLRSAYVSKALELEKSAEAILRH